MNSFTQKIFKVIDILCGVDVTYLALLSSDFGLEDVKRIHVVILVVLIMQQSHFREHQSVFAVSLFGKK
jgi:hypothetical protein